VRGKGQRVRGKSLRVGVKNNRWRFEFLCGSANGVILRLYRGYIGVI
jgi:hypothetical protein